VFGALSFGEVFSDLPFGFLTAAIAKRGQAVRVALAVDDGAAGLSGEIGQGFGDSVPMKRCSRQRRSSPYKFLPE